METSGVTIPPELLFPSLRAEAAPRARRNPEDEPVLVQVLPPAQIKQITQCLAAGTHALLAFRSLSQSSTSSSMDMRFIMSTLILPGSVPSLRLTHIS